MATIEVHAPLTLRLVGQPSEEDWRRLEDALVRCYARAFRLDPGPVPQPPRQER